MWRKTPELSWLRTRLQALEALDSVEDQKLAFEPTEFDVPSVLTFLAGRKVQESKHYRLDDYLTHPELKELGRDRPGLLTLFPPGIRFESLFEKHSSIMRL